MDLAIAAFALAPGLALGSFLNVVAARVPLRRSIVSPGSACMTCEHEIAWYDNVPLCPGSLSAVAAAIAADGSRPATPPSSSRRRCSSPAASGSSGFAPRRPRRVLLPRARRGLGDRPRAPDHPEPHRPARGGDRARRPDGAPPLAASGRSAALGASGFLFAAALAYPRGMGMGDVKLALLLGAMLGKP